ncbi:hypothetical protein PR048_005357 [Dryococelus australis]|uniref:BED-type domain-containing protein n=1 Tax=Dryococelus australis TaxID=614101 RepID=A0ABQ9I8X3_9NEOP|nr:hypothetical protein PR048_005357 [Dryococelus australis]
MGGSKLNPAWLQPLLHPEFQPWLQEVYEDPKSACCNVCKKMFALSNIGKRAVTSHMSGQVHKQELLHTAAPTSNSVAVLTSAAAVSTSVAAAYTSKLGFLPNSDVRAAEVTWVIQVISTKANSRIAFEMQLSRTKTAYRAFFGLAPYFHHMLTNDLKFAMHIVMCFDESLNRISKLLQMDLAIHFWDENKNEYIIEGVFRNLGWEIDKFMKSIYNVVKDSPALLENVVACERAIIILPHLKTYFKSKSAQLPDCLAAVHSCWTIHLLSEEKALINITVEYMINCMKLQQVKIGPVARQSSNEARVKEGYMEKYRLEVKNCLVKIVRKLIERNPLKYKFVQASTCLEHKKMTKPEQCKNGFETCIGMLLANHHVTAILANQAILQFGCFASHTDKTERVWDGIQDAGGEDAIVVDQEMHRYTHGARAKQKEAFAEQKRRETELEKLSLYERKSRRERLRNCKS